MSKRDLFALTPAEAVTALQDLTASDIASRRDVLVAVAVISGSALLGPIRQWAGAIASAIGGSGHSRLGIDDVTDLESMVRVFCSWDAETGAHRRKAVVGQLRQVAELLDGSHTRTVKTRLLEAATQMAQRAGWMSYDSRMYGVAQRYYLLSLHLCREAGNRLIAAKVMGDMSQLANTIGNHQEALELVTSALYTLPVRRPGLVRGELLGLQASTLAVLGDASDAQRSVEASLEASAKTAEGPLLPVFDYLCAAEIQCLATRTYLDLARRGETGYRSEYASRAEHHALAAVRARDDQFVRSRALDALRLMNVRLLQDEPTEAMKLGSLMMEFAGDVRASRVVDRLVDFHSEIHDRYPELPEAEEFQDRLRSYLARCGEMEFPTLCLNG